jgi:hypothetical protein
MHKFLPEHVKAHRQAKQARSMGASWHGCRAQSKRLS